MKTIKYNPQQQRTLDLIQDAGNFGVNTKDFRNHLYIQMPTTRIFEINNIWKEANHPYKIDKRTEKDGTATYFIKFHNWSTSLEETPNLLTHHEESKPNPMKAQFFIKEGKFYARI